ncbi:MAG: class I SAM-dependent methyltransferase [Actinomycetota bacterium]|nr:class I SAM-dependent methyltransferase [Actinomycetota bacterium]
MSHPADHSGHGDHSDVDFSEMFTGAFWDDRYSSADRVWSGAANPQLVANTADLAPGAALDVGCGEGADAIWLGSRGWRVTGVDVSTVALTRAAAEATSAGSDIAGRITWEQADLLTWDLAPDRFDLVSAQFVHLPPAERATLHRQLAAAVRPGGMLLVVGHHPSDRHTSIGRPDLPCLFATAEEMALVLDADDWESIDTAAPQRLAIDPDGREVTITDAVLRAVRRR